MDASHIAVAGSTELGSYAGAAGDTFDIDEPVSPFTAAVGGISSELVSHNRCIALYAMLVCQMIQ